MKRITTLIMSLAILSLIFVSCGKGPEADVKDFFNTMEKYSEIVAKAIEDNKIDDKEATDINKLVSELGELGKRFEAKYKEDEEAEKIFENLAREEKNEKILTNMMELTFKLYTCEGSEKIDFDNMQW